MGSMANFQSEFPPYGARIADLYENDYTLDVEFVLDDRVKPGRSRRER